MDVDYGDADRAISGEVAAQRPRLTAGRILACSLLVSVITFVVVVRPAARPYTLDLEDPVCSNMIGMGAYSRTGDSNRGWSYITSDPIPAEWDGERIDGTLVSWSSGARFSAEGVTLRYGITSKWGPCVGPAIN